HVKFRARHGRSARCSGWSSRLRAWRAVKRLRALVTRWQCELVEQVPTCAQATPENTSNENGGVGARFSRARHCVDVQRRRCWCMRRGRARVMLKYVDAGHEVQSPRARESRATVCLEAGLTFEMAHEREAWGAPFDVWRRHTPRVRALAQSHWDDAAG